MVHELAMPKLGLTMTEGVVAEWRVRPGEPFKAGDVLAVVETDKIASDIEAVSDGVLIETTILVGETVPVGALIARWSADKDSAISAPPVAPVKSERILSTPLARRRARERGIALGAITGTGPRGRIKAADIEAAVLPIARPEPIPAAAMPPAGGRSKPSTVQATMAHLLTAAKRDVPHFYLAAEAEVSELLALRERLNADTDARHISLTHLVIAAVGRALAAMPEMDRVWDDGDIVTLCGGDIGLAVNTPRGLLAPVLRGAAHLTLDRLAAAAMHLTARARNGQLDADDCQGGAISVSNAGMHNVTYMSSIIPPGQSSILGVGSVRSVFRPGDNGAPVLKRELGLVLSADHRLFDGVTALAFLNRIIAGLEQPLRLLRGV